MIFRPRLFSIVCVILGFFVGSLVISQLSAHMVEFRTQQLDKVEKLQNLQRYLHENGVSPTLVIKTVAQARQRLYTKRMLTTQETTALDVLSSGLRREIHAHTCMQPLLGHSLFHALAGIDLGWVLQLCAEAIGTLHLSVADELFSFGTMCCSTYIISSGQVRYQQDINYTPSGGTTLHSDGEWLCESAFWSEWMHVGHAEASETTKLLTIDCDSFRKCVASSRIYGVVREYGRQFHRRVTSAEAPMLPFPTDVRVPNSDFPDMLLSMRSEIRIFVSRLLLRRGFSLRRRSLRVLSWGPRADSEEVVCQDLEAGNSAVIVDIHTSEAVFITGKLEMCIRSDRGWRLMHLGCVQESHIEVVCKWLAAERLGGETAHDVMKRVLANELATFAKYLTMESMSTIAEELQATSFLEVRRRCLTTQCRGTLNEDYRKIAFEAGQVLSGDESEAVNQEMLAVPLFTSKHPDGGVYLYALVLDELWDHLQTERGHSEVRALLGCLRHSVSAASYDNDAIAEPWSFAFA